jgi:hypothetical protein
MNIDSQPRGEEIKEYSGVELKRAKEEGNKITEQLQ